MTFPRFLTTAILAWVMLSATVAQAQRRRPTVKLTTTPIRSEEKLYKRTPQGELFLHVFYPPEWKPEDRRPVVVFFFGGGWKNGAYTQFVPQSEYFASRGLVAISADYRISSKHMTTPDKCVEDAKTAIRWVRTHAGELGIDPDRVIAAGGSAGGHLAAATALVAGFEDAADDRSVSTRPNALVLFNPALNLNRNPIRDADGNDIAAALSPTRFLKDDLPPTILFYGTADPMLAQGEEFVKKAQERGQRVELYTAEGVGHSFFNRTPWIEATARQADEFLTLLGYLSGTPTIVQSEDAPDLKRFATPKSE